MLANGDITKRESILWGVTLEQTEPYLKVIERKVLYREAVIAFLTGGQEEGEPQPGNERAAYCKACRAAGKNDCSRCNPATITTVH